MKVSVGGQNWDKMKVCTRGVAAHIQGPQRRNLEFPMAGPVGRELSHRAERESARLLAFARVGGSERLQPGQDNFIYTPRSALT